MARVADIMTTPVASITDSEHLNAARQLMKEKQIRHLPVVNAEQRLVGVVTQRAVLASVIKLVDRVGVDKMEAEEKQIPISSIMESNFQTASPDLNLKEAARHFLHHKHSCLPVIDDSGKLVGIVTSQDFVKLCETLL